MIRVQAQDFDVGAEMKALGNGNTGIGGMASFVGLVRDMAGGSGDSAMTLEHYPGMTESEIEMIIDQAKSRWPLAKITVIHRVGRMLPTENIVFVGCSSAHREAAFDGANFIMDFLKTKAPFWKLEDGLDGAKWVDARDSDSKALDRWNLPE